MAVHRLGELFAGPGGIALGASIARITGPSGAPLPDRIIHQWATDYDRDTCRTFTQNIPGASEQSVIHSDVRELDFENLKATNGGIDGLAFGFPCNDYSIVGEQKGLDGEYGPLYQYGVKGLETFRPKWFLAENVNGIQSANSGGALGQITKEFAGAGPGYTITSHLYKFEEYGVPQSRHRIILVGIRNDLGLTFKVPSNELYSHLDVSAKTAINAAYGEGVTGQEATRHTERVLRRLEAIPEGGNAWTAEEQTPVEVRLNVKGARLSQIYRRLHRDKPAYTVTGSGGGGTYIYHWEENRSLTNRERARLQTFPDDYNFFGNRGSVRKQIGMAVPPEGAQVIFEAILKTFAGVPYEDRPAKL